MLSSSVRIQTSNPSRLIRRLCKHWGHKFEVNFDDQHGRIALGETTCLLEAGEGSLKAELQAADEAQLSRMEGVVADHLQRMATDEAFTFVWQR